MQQEHFLLKELENYSPFDQSEQIACHQLRYFLTHDKNPYDRENIIAHVVADAWVINPSKTHVLLMFHSYKNFWMTPGGHCDGNPNVLESAIREVWEETGLKINIDQPRVLFDVNTGYVPQKEKAHGIEPEHLHFDICYLFEGDDTAVLSPNEESSELKWIPISELDQYKVMDCHTRRILKTKQKWAEKE